MREGAAAHLRLEIEVLADLAEKLQAEGHRPDFPPFLGALMLLRRKQAELAELEATSRVNAP